MQQEKPKLKAEREARLWRKVQHPKRPPGTPRQQWEAELRAAFRDKSGAFWRSEVQDRDGNYQKT